jgi:hypothetical protein
MCCVDIDGVMVVNVNVVVTGFEMDRRLSSDESDSYHAKRRVK